MATTTADVCTVLLRQLMGVQTQLRREQCAVPDGVALVTGDEPVASEHDHDHDHDHGHSHGGCNGMEGAYSLGLHIGAIFVVLLASVLGTLVPLLSKRISVLRIHPYVFALGKSAAAGVMLSVAAIHMINESGHAFELECLPASFREAYEGWAFVFAMIAALFMHLLDLQLGEVAQSWLEKRQEPRTTSAADSTVGGSPPDMDGSELCTKAPAVSSSCTEHGEQLPGCQNHHHGVIPTEGTAAKRVVAAVCMEFGMALHSVFVGLALGIANDASTKVLLVALTFHQLFEGLAMGSRIAEAEFRLSLEIVLMLVFSISAPVGVAAGTGAVSASRDALAGGTYVMVQAVCSSLCGGILLYLSFMMMLVDFPADLRRHCGMGAKHRLWKKLGMYVSLWIGVSVMIVLGKWA